MLTSLLAMSTLQFGNLAQSDQLGDKWDQTVTHIVLHAQNKLPLNKYFKSLMSFILKDGTMVVVLTWMKALLPQWDSLMLITLLCYFTPATVCGCSDQGATLFVRGRCCWGCLLGQFGTCSYLVIYSKASALRHPWGSCYCILPRGCAVSSSKAPNP